MKKVGTSERERRRSSYRHADGSWPLRRQRPSHFFDVLNCDRVQVDES